MSKKWDFVYDEERYDDEPGGVDGFYCGVLSDGVRFLFWCTNGFMGQDCTMGIFNSILMREKDLECSFPWTTTNERILLDCLNGLEEKELYCGEGSPIRTLEFKPFEDWRGERHIDLPYIRSLLLGEDSKFASVDYDGASDTLSLVVKEADEPLVHQSFELFNDLGYFRAHYETTRGPVGYARMFRGNDDIHPDLEGDCYPETDDPDILYEVLDALDKADTQVVHIEIDYGVALDPEGDLPFDGPKWTLATDFEAAALGQRICRYTNGKLDLYTRTDLDDIRGLKGTCLLYSSFEQFLEGYEDISFADCEENRSAVLKALDGVHSDDIRDYVSAVNRVTLPF